MTARRGRRVVLRLRRGALLAVAVVLAGCGGSDDNRPAATPTNGGAATEDAKAALAPPEIYVVSAGARQRATPRSSCVMTVGQGRGEGEASCEITRGRGRPRTVTLVNPGDEITIEAPGARIIRRPGCDDPRECGGRVVVRSLGCARKVTSFALGASATRWRVGLPPGAYALEISIDFVTDEDLTGDASAVAGLLVSPRERDPVVVRSRPAMARCERSRRD